MIERKFTYYYTIKRRDKNSVQHVQKIILILILILILIAVIEEQQRIRFDFYYYYIIMCLVVAYIPSYAL